MVDQITFQTVSIMIAATTVVIGVINSIMSGRREEKQRQDNIILQRFQGYNLDYFKAWNDVMTTAGWEDTEDYFAKPEVISKFLYVASTYNIAGLSVKRGADPDLIFQLYSPNSTISMWEQYEPVVKHLRKLTNNPLLWEPIEFLYNEAKKRYPEVRRAGLT